MKKLVYFLLFIALISFACKSSAVPSYNTYSDYYQNNPMVHQIGNIIVDPNQKPLRLRGVNLGGWLLWEGWDFSKGTDISENKIDAGLTNLVGA